jgi:hypothetical protein
MLGQYNRGEDSGTPHPFSARRTLQDFFSRPGDDTPGLLIDITALKMALDERSMTEFARSMAYGDTDDTSHCPVAIVAGLHRSYIACIFAQLPDKAHEIRVFGTTDEARQWLTHWSE